MYLGPDLMNMDSKLFERLLPYLAQRKIPRIVRDSLNKDLVLLNFRYGGPYVLYFRDVKDSDLLLFYAI